MAVDGSNKDFSSGRRILIVDDDRDSIESLNEVLKSRGYLTEAAKGVEEACNKIEDFDADVALVNVCLGGERGIDLLSWLRGKRPTLICVMMVLREAADTAIEAIQEGAYDYLQKPLEERELLATLDRCFERIRLENEREAAEHAIREKSRELTDTNRRLRAIVKSTGKLTAASKIKEMGRILLEEFKENMDVEGGSLYIIEDDSLILAHSLDPGHAAEKIPLPLEKGTILEKALREGGATLIEDIEKAGGLKKSGWNGYKDGSLLVFSLNDSTDEIKGIITLHNKARSSFNDKDSEMGQILASFSYEALRAAGALEEVKKGRENLQTLFDTMEDLLFIYQYDGKIVHVNPAVERRLGYPIEELLGTDFNNLLSIGRGQNKDKIAGALFKGNSGIYAVPLLKTDKTSIPVEAKCTRGRWGGDDVVFCICRDISKRILAEEALKRSEEKYRDIIENAVDVIFTIDLKGAFLQVNDSFLRESGYRRDEIIGKNSLTTTHPDDYSILREALKESLKGNSFEAEIRAIDKKGDYKWFSTITRPVKDRGGSVVSINIVARNINDRVLTERALIESEDKYRTLVDSAKEAILVLQDNLVKFSNPKTVEISGYSEEELASIPLEKFIHPEDLEEVLSRYFKEINGEDFLKPNLYRLLRKDGSIRWVEGTGISITWDGKPASLTFLSDVTEKKKAEEALVESEEKYRILVEQANDGIIIVQEKKIKYVNRRVCEIGGYDANEIIDTDFFDFVHPDEADKVSANYRNRISGKYVPSTYESAAKHKNGRRVDVEFNASMIMYRGEPAILIIIRDITERKAAEEALKESEERYRNLFQSSRDTIYLSTIGGRFEDINQAGEKLFGYARDELLNMDLKDIYKDPDYRKEIQEALNREGFLTDYEITFRKKDGTFIETLVTSSVRRDETGEIIGYQGIIKDMTEKKSLEAQLVQTQKMEALGTLAGGMAHNFNNILVGIMGYSEYLLIKKDEDDPDYKALKTIYDGTLRASDLTKQLLNIARGEEYKFTNLNLNDVVERILPLISGIFEKSITIETCLEEDLLTIKGDRGHLEQCLLNLCINSKDAMPMGGRLIIETRSKLLDEDFVRMHIGAKKGDYVVLTVTDTGIGMTKDVKERIFEPFFSTKEHKGGTGMGLSTIYGIMQKHSGIITVYSEVGEGSSFKLYFPAIPEAAKAADSEMDIGKAAGDETLLIIDDEAIVVDMWSDFLKDTGYKVITATNGEEGIGLFTEMRDEIDLVILDYVLPGMSGMETFRKLKEIDPDVKVLISSGYTENGKAKDILMEGGDGFIQKPARLNDLNGKIREILDK
ncbi:MAG: PAS domain S-box protein [Deltaproteobacteria bacterium]|uniref:histidine kinase n=1 Tax=Candidatus Zymogenus saltonus TaxID=2844893 RepID=A0A9D8KJB6_9DELT|nr:PAS domain S-box protein [Candidatus Zymogenus saltonus]